MNHKQLLVIGTMLPGLLVGAPKKPLAEQRVTMVKNKTVGVLENEEKMNPCSTKKICDIKGGPLEMQGVEKKNRLSQFLGLNQYECILKDFNPNCLKIDPKGRIIDDKSSYEAVAFPKIYPGLQNTFPSDLNEFIFKNPGYAEDVSDDKDVIILKKSEEGLFSLGYYIDGILFVATHVSPGKPSKPTIKYKKDKVTGKLKKVVIQGGVDTPEGVFEVTKDSRFHRSTLFESGDLGSPMPFAIHVTGGVYLHHGSNVDGKKRSHGCIRVPGFYQELIYKSIKDGTKIIIKGTKTKKKTLNMQTGS